MRILQVVHDFLPKAVGGTEIYTYDLCKELSKRNDVCLFFGDSGIDIAESIKRGYYDDLAFMSINPLLYAGHFAYLNLLKPGKYFTCTNKRVDKAFKTLIEEFRPEVIHFQHLLGLSTNLVNIAYQARIPVVFTAHDFWLLCPKAHLIDNNLNICTAINKSKCVKCLWSSEPFKFKGVKISQPKTYIELPQNLARMILNLLLLAKMIIYIFHERPKAIREVIRKVDLFVVPSRCLRDKLIEHGVPKDKLVYINSGIDIAPFRNISKTPSNQLRFAFIGHVALHKGIHILIDAFNNIEDATLAIYGAGSEKVKKEYMKSIKNENIQFKGEIEHEEVSRIFSDIDVLIVPSVCAENSPLTIREAFAARTPVIASDIGGLPELVQDGKTGLLFKIGDPKDLLEKIMYFIDNPGEVKRMSNEIGPVKTIEENAAEMETIYKELINKNCRGKS